MSAPERLAAELRRRILDGDLAPGAPLREQALAVEHAAARHTVRAALRVLSAEGLARFEPNRGVRVLSLEAADLEAFGDLRVALEVEAARLALRRHGCLPPPVWAAARTLRQVAGGTSAEVAEAHGALHAAIVAAAGSPRLEAAHRALAVELQVFLVQLRPAWDVDALAEEHETLLAAIESDGPEVLRAHVEASTWALRDLLGGAQG